MLKASHSSLAEHNVRGRGGRKRQSGWRLVNAVLLDKCLHYLRVEGFTALTLIPGVKASVPHLRIGNKLLLAAPQLPFGPVQEWRLCTCVAPSRVRLRLGYLPALSSCVFLEGCRNQPALVWFCFLSIKGLRL